VASGRETTIIVQARMESARFPGKVLANVLGRPLLGHVLERAAEARCADTVVVATSNAPEDDPIVEYCEGEDVAVFRGSREDCLGRYYEAAAALDAEVIVRLTADNPLIDPALIDQVIRLRTARDLDYAASALPHWRKLPLGMDVEAFTFAALELAHLESTRLSEREHVTLYFWDNPNRFACDVLDHPHDASRHRLTVDYPEDLVVVRRLLEAEADAGQRLDVDEIVAWLDAHPEVAAINEGIRPYEGWDSILAVHREGGTE
jgi:spore coat polysaccharide biosynthesis protein SpsF